MQIVFELRTFRRGNKSCGNKKVNRVLQKNVQKTERLFVREQLNSYYFDRFRLLIRVECSIFDLWIVQCLIFTSLGHIKPYIKNLLEYKCVSHLTTIGVSIFFLKFRWKLAIRLDVVDSTTRQPGYNNWPFKGNLYVK